MQLVKRIKILEGQQVDATGTVTEAKVQKRYTLVDLSKVDTIGLHEIQGVKMLKCILNSGLDLYLDIDTSLIINGKPQTLVSAIDADRGAGNV